MISLPGNVKWLTQRMQVRKEQSQTVIDVGVNQNVHQLAVADSKVSSNSLTLLVPDTAVLPDQSQHMVMTVSADGTVAPKRVEVGEIRDGLRVIRSGLAPSDRVIVDGLLHVAPGTKVATQDGTIRYSGGQD
jgi:hypothetical protein